MRKLGIKVLIFGIIFLVLIKVIGRFDNIDRETSTNPNIIRIANAHRFDSLDILFVGSSASYSGINPAFFDNAALRTYNLSVAAAGPWFYDLLVDDYIRSVKKKPITIFLLIMPTTFSTTVDDFKEIGIHRYLNSAISNGKIVQTYSEWETYPSLIIKSFQKGTKNLLFRQKASAITIAQEISDKGFYRSDEQTSTEKEKKESVLYIDWKLQEFQEKKFTYLQQLARDLKARGITVIFFSLPGNKSSSFFSSKYMMDYMRAELALKKDWKFLDLSTLQLDSTCYRNIDHLNTHGASVVSSRLAAEIGNDSSLSRLFHISNTSLNK